MSRLLSTFSARHLIFLAVLLAVTVPLLLDVRLTHTASDETKRFYANIDSLPSGSVMLISFDFEASAFAEIKPLAEVVLRHCFRQNLRVIGLSLFAKALRLVNRLCLESQGRRAKHTELIMSISVSARNTPRQFWR